MKMQCVRYKALLLSNKRLWKDLGYQYRFISQTMATRTCDVIYTLWTAISYY